MRPQPARRSRARAPRSPRNDFEKDKAELLALMHQQGICRSSDTQVILDAEGQRIPWALDSLSVSLTPRGAELVARCLLELLRRFDGTQLATYGLTAIPLLQSCVALSGGRYRGLLVRKEVKPHGTLKRIEGQYDPSEPVIILDDTVAGGSSFNRCRAYLEEAGLRVEGAVCLVRFGWHSAFSQLQEQGFHMESVFDIQNDFIYPLEGSPEGSRDPATLFDTLGWSEHTAPEGLHPATLARVAIEEYQRSGKALRPPRRLDASHDGGGGVVVSLRSRSDVRRRHARDGFWRFPGEARYPLPQEIILAALRTGRRLPPGEPGRRLLAECALAVSLFSELEECTVGQLDNERYGLVVRSRERPLYVGGSLPRMPGFSSEWRQFQHARLNNAQLTPTEPFTLYRHEVHKAVEPGEVWQPTGVPATEESRWGEDARLGGRVARRARDIVLAHLTGARETVPPLPRELLPSTVDTLFVSIYFAGQVRGCVGAPVRDLDEDVRQAALGALMDERFEQTSSPVDPEHVAVKVTLLHTPTELGELSPEEAATQVRLGKQALMAYQGEHTGLMLPEVVAQHGMSAVAFAHSVLEKAGITRASYRWCHYDCVSWLADPHGAHRMEGAFPVARPTRVSLDARLRRLGGLFSAYLVRHQHEDGTLNTAYSPFQDVATEGAGLPWLSHASWTLARAARLTGDERLARAARSALAYLVSRTRPDEYGRWWVGERETASIAEVSFVLLSLAELPDEPDLRRAAPQWATTLWTSIDAHGRFATHRLPTSAEEEHQDYFPAQALLALARATEEGLTQVDEVRLSRAFRYYRHRFHYRRDWGQVTWLLQALSAWWHVRRDEAHAALAFEVADWMLGYQQEKTGGFINEHQDDAPGYTTAVYLEGLAAALRLAEAVGDTARARRYLKACERGWAFVDSIVYQERDEPILPNIEWALGGVRVSATRGDIRTDLVQHALCAVVELQSALSRERSPVARGSPSGERATPPRSSS